MKVLSGTKAVRCIVLRKTNGTGLPYVHIEHEVYDGTVNPVLKDFQGVEMDKHYQSMIENLTVAKEVTFKVESLNPESILRMVYERDSLTDIVLFEVGRMDGVYRYGSFASREPFSRDEKLIMKLAVRSIKQVYRKR